MNKKIAAIAAGIVVVFATTAGACTKSVNIEQANAIKVPGANGLYAFCHDSTLIYFSKIDGSSDEYEAFFYGGCVWDEVSGKFIPAIGRDIEPRTSPTDPNNDEMNQQDEREDK